MNLDSPKKPSLTRPINVASIASGSVTTATAVKDPLVVSPLHSFTNAPRLAHNQAAILVDTVLDFLPQHLRKNVEFSFQIPDMKKWNTQINLKNLNTILNTYTYNMAINKFEIVSPKYCSDQAVTTE